jgi:hypothetical protein
MAILPNPICATLILLLGALAPNTEEGTIVGTINPPAIAAEELFRKFLLSILFGLFDTV